MARPLRLEYPGALYHVTARGNARARIYLNDQDGATFSTCWAASANGITGRCTPIA